MAHLQKYFFLFMEKQPELRITQIIQDALKHGDNINLVGFGKFEVKHRAKRVSFNPQTKKMQTIPSKKVPTFKAGKALKSAIG